jgi:hypothetical protein
VILKDEALLDRFRAAWRCEWCAKPTPSGCDPHHCFSRGAGRVDLACNLIALERDCHNKAGTGQIPGDALLALVAKREGLQPAECRRRVNAVRRYDAKRGLARGLTREEMIEEALGDE